MLKQYDCFRGRHGVPCEALRLWKTLWKVFAAPAETRIGISSKADFGSVTIHVKHCKYKSYM
jgi:hypothetical protein